jgi:hypothetical protein
VFKGGRAGIAAGRRGIRIPAISPAVSGTVAWSREGKEGGGPDGRGRAVSGGSGRRGSARRIGPSGRGARAVAGLGWAEWRAGPRTGGRGSLGRPVHWARERKKGKR